MKNQIIYVDKTDYSGLLQGNMPIPYYKSPDNAFNLLHGDAFELLPQFDFKFDMIFADPPYFLSSGGISVQSGKPVCVDKGDWDKGGTPEHIYEFNYRWLSLPFKAQRQWHDLD